MQAGAAFSKTEDESKRWLRMSVDTSYALCKLESRVIEVGELV
jgi:hypothetical protein